MITLLTFLKQNILQAFWFIPAVFSLLALFATAALNWLDVYLALQSIPSLSWAYTKSPEGARALLSTIAGSSITVLGVILSTMIVVLTLASQQYGPRLVRNFIEDRPSQVVVGSFAGCFIYSLITLKSIRSADAASQPHLSILGAVLLAMACIGLLIYFVHHVSSEIQVQSIIRRVYKNLSDSINTLFPEGLGQEVDEVEEPSIDTDASSFDIVASRSGYIQTIDESSIVEVASVHDLVLQLKVRPGDFVVKDETLISVLEDKSLDEDTERSLRFCLLIGTFPTAAQDVRFPIGQLEEIAVRALSPGVNDPHTAIECLDYLTASIRQLSTRPWPKTQRYDGQQALRIVAEPLRFETLLRLAYQQIHHYGRADVTIVCEMLGDLGLVVERMEQHPQRKETLLNFAQEIYVKSRDTMAAESDRAKIKIAYEALKSC